MSLEKPKSVEAEAVTVAEGKMCGAAMRPVGSRIFISDQARVG